MHGRGDVAGTPCVETHDDLCLASSNRLRDPDRAFEIAASAAAFSVQRSVSGTSFGALAGNVISTVG